ncbi:alpha/beta hydrolase [Aureitalea marina]|uniref:Esterase n=1 Tax=Aureitalea marina TaxID=930804 RepID=A0A2S7KNM1_9FLAO|nr:esterase [Aureitalea marina]PQB04200.1 esterase [Aureitalea marina]
MSTEKRINYQASNTYSTLNKLSADTQRIWMVFHGMGYLSRYFIRHFKNLDPVKNYIIAPQAPSKYYQGPDFKHVGASWLTREDTVNETDNVLNYVEGVWQAELAHTNCELIVLGYSQGVSIATRWLAKYQRRCDQLIIHSGGLPKELTAKDFSHFQETTKVHYVFGNSDPYINQDRLDLERKRAEALFGSVQERPFKGAHVVNEEYLLQI